MNLDSESVGDEGRVLKAPLRASLGVGSFFESSDESAQLANQALPWSSGVGLIHLQSGRQALRLLSERLWTDGYRRLIVPGYLCESMIEPFHTRGWLIRFSSLDDRLRPVAQRYEEMCLQRPGETVALIAEYFGRSLTDGARATVARLRDRGVAVIEDRSHNFLDRPASPATYEFGSLRKLLPVGDGCFVRGLQGDPQLVPGHLDPSKSSWKAMDLKLAARSPGDVECAFGQYKHAETEFGIASEPAEMSARSFRALESFDLEAMAAARKENFEVLRGLISSRSDCQ